jgi:hypothetical protein
MGPHSPHEIVNRSPSIQIQSCCQVSHDLLDQRKTRTFLAGVIKSHKDKDLLSTR